MNRSSGVIKQRIILFLRTLGYFFCRNISGPSTTGLTMKTSIFFHETFRLSYYHIYLPPAKIWEESEMFGNWTCLPVPPLLQWYVMGIVYIVWIPEVDVFSAKDKVCIIQACRQSCIEIVDSCFYIRVPHIFSCYMLYR